MITAIAPAPLLLDMRQLVCPELQVVPRIRVAAEQHDVDQGNRGRTAVSEGQARQRKFGGAGTAPSDSLPQTRLKIEGQSLADAWRNRFGASGQGLLARCGDLLTNSPTATLPNCWYHACARATLGRMADAAKPAISTRRWVI